MPKLIVIFISLLLCSSLVQAAEPNSQQSKVINTLLKDIKQAQKNLSTTQKKLAKLSNTLGKKVREQEQRVIALREKAAVSQRLQDEKTLSLQQLQERLKTWSDQNQYQQNVLSRFNHNISNEPFSAKAPSQQKLAWLSTYLDDIHHKIVPSWYDQKIVMANGELHSAKILNIGPVNWFVANDLQHAGFASLIETDASSKNKDAALYKVEVALSDQESEGLVQLMNTGSGTISLDPTLTRAFKINSQKETLLDHITKGGIWIFPIVFFGFFAVMIALMKAIQFWRLPALIPAFNERFAQLEKITSQTEKQSAKQALFSQAKGMQAELVAIAQNSEIGAKRDDRLFANLLSHKHKLDYWLGAIAITAAVSPLLGLLGTVSGMIETFKLMTLFGAGDPSAVSGGISQALVTTELGLVVAIPALLLHALLSRRVKTYYGELETCGVTLSQLENEK